MISCMKNTDIFKLNSDAIIVPVNTVGIMGAGLAKVFREKYPEAFDRYRQFCKTDLSKLDEFRYFPQYHKWVYYFVTKHHWKNPSKLEYVEESLIKMRDWLDTYILGDTGKPFVIAVPKVGCGLGGLNWEKQVKPLINKYLSKYKDDSVIDIRILE